MLGLLVLVSNVYEKPFERIENCGRDNFLLLYSKRKEKIFMCKYCKMRTLNERIGEKSNDNPTIATMKDGSQVFEVSLDRYVIEEGGTRNNWLWLGLSVDADGGSIYLKEKHIKIKYCPFCGEEL